VLPQPALRCYPDNLDDLLQIVADAESVPLVKPEVHACGSHWALSHAAVTNGLAVETQAPEGTPERLNRVLYDVIPPCITQDAKDYFRARSPGKFDPSKLMNDSTIYLFHVEAGMRIYELYSRLDQGDDAEPRSLAAELAKSGIIYDGPWAMGTLGGAGGQTIMGAISTGTHGGDVQHPPIADTVQAIHLVGAGGRQHWIERPLPNGAPLIDDAKLRGVYPKIEVHHDETMLAAAVIAAGRMGIIYSVVLRVARQYALEEHKSKDNWSTVRTWITGTSAPLFTTNRFVQVVINPNGQPDNRSEHTCYITTRKLVPLLNAYSPPALPLKGDPLGRRERGNLDPGKGDITAGNSAPMGSSGSFYTAICKTNDWVKAALDYEIGQKGTVRDAALATAAALELVILNPLTLPGTQAWALNAQQIAFATAAAADAVIALLHYIIDNVLPPLGGRFGDTIAALANWCADNDHFEILRQAAEYAFAKDQADPTPTAISYAVMDVHNYLDVACSGPGDSLEVFLDAKSPNVVAFVDKLLQRVSDLANGALDNGTPQAFAGYLSLRFMGPSFGLLAMQKSVPECSFEVAGLGRVHGTETFLRTIEADAVSLGARVHWGQRNNQPMKTVEMCWNPAGPAGDLFLWRKALSDLSENGRYPTFSTEFTRYKGLEVVQPILADFSVNLTNACAGEPIHITWAAIKNPPETRARLEIRPHSSSTPVAPTFETSELNGSQDVAVPAGTWDFTMIVARELNGRTLTDQRVFEVRGFGNGDVWTFDFTAACTPIDGASRWAYEINLWSVFISDNLRVEELYSTCSAWATWHVRTPGLPDIPFGPVNSRHTFAAPPVFNRSWLFFLNTTGCGGIPPDFHAEFQLVCGR
jgi:hypothetical protein